MTPATAGVLGAVELCLAVVVWPRRRSAYAARAVLRTSSGARATSGRPESDAPGFWQQDPVDRFRRWRLRRRPGDLLDDVLELLRGVTPGLESGLTPSRAITLAAVSLLGAERVARARDELQPGSRRARSQVGLAEIDVLVAALLDAADRATPLSPVWSLWAGRVRSPELALVAAAWRLSESTGAPLASAVDRAVRGLLDARSRRGKVAVAVAGPRATVTVLTLLPLTGPLFGLACGVGPVDLYLGSPVATAAAASGLILLWAGRAWCHRLIRRAVRT